MKYFALVGVSKTEKSNTTFELILGSYEKQDLKDEKDCLTHEYKKMKIVTLDNDNDAAIVTLLNTLNGITTEVVEVLDVAPLAQSECVVNPQNPQNLVTPLQAAMLIKIAKSEFNAVDGNIPNTVEDSNTWAEMIIETAQDKGVFTSLLNVGLVFHFNDGKDSTVQLSVKGLNIVKELNK